MPNRVFRSIVLCCVLASCFLTGCRILKPVGIEPQRNNFPSTLTPDGEPLVERGKPRPIIDAVGWVVGIPSKIILWNRRVENHSISPETEYAITEYMAINGLDEVKIRLNQYRPIDDWKRLTRNTSVAWPWRYTFGTMTVLGETIFPGRIFGGDHYNAYTGTIHLYSDLPSIALHEGAHAKDFSRRKYPGTYAAVYALPIVPLWHESIATNDVLSYVEFKGDPELRRETYHVLYPAFGTYLGSAAGTFAPNYSSPLYAAGILAGHASGRWRAAHPDVLQGRIEQ